jgi:hypothetical protein
MNEQQSENSLEVASELTNEPLRQPKGIEIIQQVLFK